MKGKVDTKKLMAQLTLEMYERIFKELNIPVYSKSSNHWLLYTACHNRNPYDGSPKLYFYLNNRIFVCYTGCSTAMNIITLIMKRLTLLGKPDGFLNAVNTILSISGLDKDAVSRISSSKYTYDWEGDFGKFIRFKNGVSELVPYDKNILSTLQDSLPLQWLEEGISIETMQKYQIGYYERQNQTTIPCFNKAGELIGIRVRNWRPNLVEDAKYIPLFTLDGNSYKFDTKKVFYGINYNWPQIEETGTVYIGESEKFVLKFDTWFSEKNTALGMFGGNLGLLRRNQLIKMGVKRVVYVPDNDFEETQGEKFDLWEKKVLAFVDLFKGFCQVEVVWDREGTLGYKENASDNTREVWEQLYEERQIFKL